MGEKIQEKVGAPVDSGNTASSETLRLLSEMNSTLRQMNSHLKALVYYQQPSRGFQAGIDQAIAQPFVSEGKQDIKDMIREELSKLNQGEM